MNVSDAPVALKRSYTGTKSTYRQRAIGLLANEWVCAAAIFGVTRLVAVLGAYSGISTLIAAEPTRNKGWVAELALMWDATHYTSIAQGFYQYDPLSTGGSNIAFPPLFPFLVWAVSQVLSLLTLGWDWGNATYGTTIASGLLVSNVSFYVALVLLNRLLTPRLGYGGAALVAMALASLPHSFFFSAIYSEGLFLLLTVAAFAVARTEWRLKWLCAGLLGMLATLDRFVGLALLPALAVEYMSQHGWQWRRVRLNLAWLLLVPLGAGIYLAFLWLYFGTPYALSDTMLKGWDQRSTFFVTAYWERVVQLWQSYTGSIPPDLDPVLHYGNGSRVYMVFNLVMPLLLLVGCALARKKIRASEWAWVAFGILFPLSSNATFALARYVLPLWPGLIWLGTLKGRGRWVAGILILASLPLLYWCSRTFASGRWIG